MSETKKTSTKKVEKKEPAKKTTAVKVEKKVPAKKVEKKVPAKKVESKTPVKKTTIKKTEKKVVAKVVDEKSFAKKTAPSGKYIKSVGRRKTAVAQARLYFPGKGDITINNKEAVDFLSEDNLSIALQPLKSCSKLKDFDFTIIVKGGGSFGQIDAIKHGIARALLKYDPELKAILKANAYLTRDSRKKERKKPGLKKARKAPQWSKR